MSKGAWDRVSLDLRAANLMIELYRFGSMIPLFFPSLIRCSL